MSNLIRIQDLEEGLIFNKYLNQRMINSNKNVIGIVLGATGSGKSYTCLRIAELWYKYHFKKDFPIFNVCFSVEEVISILNQGRLKRGDVIILEEAGTSMGALDFQTKISKVFTYVLQSFRNLNLCLILNLPYASMLNKNVRLLSHFTFETTGIDYQTKTSKIKPFFNQVNTKSGKIYPKYPKINLNGRTTKIKRFNYKIPSKELIESYEKRKKDFVMNLIADVKETISETKPKPTGKYLTEQQKKILESYKRLGKQTLVSKELEISTSLISAQLRSIRKKGFLD